jgi:hypothetical protein
MRWFGSHRNEQRDPKRENLVNRPEMVDQRGFRGENGGLQELGSAPSIYYPFSTPI